MFFSPSLLSPLSPPKPPLCFLPPYSSKVRIFFFEFPSWFTITDDPVLDLYPWGLASFPAPLHFHLLLGTAPSLCSATLKQSLRVFPVRDPLLRPRSRFLLLVIFLFSSLFLHVPDCFTFFLQPLPTSPLPRVEGRRTFASFLSRQSLILAVLPVSCFVLFLVLLFLFFEDRISRYQLGAFLVLGSARFVDF